MEIIKEKWKRDTLTILEKESSKNQVEKKWDQCLDRMGCAKSTLWGKWLRVRCYQSLSRESIKKISQSECNVHTLEEHPDILILLQI